MDGESLLDFAKRRAEFFGLGKPTPKPDAKALVRSLGVSSVGVIASSLGDDLIPDISTEKSEEQYEMDAILDRIDVVEAYNRWISKPNVDPAGKTTNIMISCPMPGHEDKVPSADINLTKGDGGVWHCHRCGVGGDKYTIAAVAFGMDINDYQSKENFPELRRIMAESLGYRVVIAGKDEWLVKDEPTPATKTTTPDRGTTSDAVAAPTPVLPVPTAADVASLTVLNESPTLNWRNLPGLGPETFLARWMTLASESFEPEEFYLWEGLMALGAAVGNKVTYADSIPVRANLMVCLVGATGAGKSIAMSLLEELLHKAMPYQKDAGTGVRSIGSAGSGEALLDQFVNQVTDTSTGTKMDLPVNGLVKDGELGALVKRMSRNGNTIREVLMDLYDRPLPVSIVSRGHGEATAKDHFMQMFTSTQPGSIRNLLTNADGTAGFLNRWVFAFGQTKFRPPRTTFRADVTPAVEPLRLVRSWASTRPTVTWADDAAGPLWDDFYERRIRPFTLDEDSWLTSRLPLLAKKLVLLFAINDHSEHVRENHVRCVEAMWDYLLSCYGIVESSVGMDDLNTCMAAIVQYMVERDEPLTIRTISKSSGAKRFGQDIINKSVDILARGGIIEEVPRSRSERIARYRLPDDESVRPNLSVVGST
jgi:hypothetical protein